MIFRFAFALLERIQIVQNVVPHLFQIFRNTRVRIFFFQFFNHAVHKHRRRFLLQITQFARQFPRQRQRLPVNHRKFLPELFVLPFDLFRNGRIEFSFVHHLRNVLDRHHLPFEHGENLGQRHRAHLHVPQRKLVPRDSSREIIHQIFFTRGKPLHNAALLPLKWFSFEHLRNPPPQKIDARLHVFLESVGVPARQRNQSRTVGDLEIIDVAAIRRFLHARLQLLNHSCDRPAAARSRQSANENVVARRAQFHAHFQRTQRALLSDKSFAQIRLRRRFEWQPCRLASPPKLFRLQRNRLRNFFLRFVHTGSFFYGRVL